MSLNRTPIWRGARGLTENEDSPELLVDISGARLTQTYTGTYDTCLAKRPPRGTAVHGWPTMAVDSSSVKRQPGGRGVLTVVSKQHDNASPAAEGAEGGDATTSTTLELDWARYDMPLATHSRYKDDLTSADLAKAEQAIANPDIPLAGSSDKLTEYIRKRRQGTDSYALYAPVVRRTKRSTAPLGYGSCGKIATPPIAVSGFEFLKTADNNRQQDGRWIRAEEWTGAYEWDPDLYSP